MGVAGASRCSRRNYRCLGGRRSLLQFHRHATEQESAERRLSGEQVIKRTGVPWTVTLGSVIRAHGHHPDAGASATGQAGKNEEA